MIDVITTATLRAKLFENTLSSFINGMFLDTNDYRLIINIDPIGEDVLQQDMLDVANKYFDNVCYNCPKTPSFSKAVMWCWSQATADYVFILEDDWILCKEIDINDMIEIHKNHPDLASLKLNKFPSNPTKFSKQNRYLFEDKLSFNPNLLKGEVVRTIAPLIIADKNPEKQVRLNNPVMRDYLEKWKWGIYTGGGYKATVFDTGRPWMKHTKFKKPIGFMQWELK